MLREDERCFIYQNNTEYTDLDVEVPRNAKYIVVNFTEIKDKVKSIYYYAIHKIRKWMGGD